MPPVPKPAPPRAVPIVITSPGRGDEYGGTFTVSGTFECRAGGAALSVHYCPDPPTHPAGCPANVNATIHAASGTWTATFKGVAPSIANGGSIRATLTCGHLTHHYTVHGVKVVAGPRIVIDAPVPDLTTVHGAAIAASGQYVTAAGASAKAELVGVGTGLQPVAVQLPNGTTPWNAMLTASSDTDGGTIRAELYDAAGALVARTSVGGIRIDVP